MLQRVPATSQKTQRAGKLLACLVVRNRSRILFSNDLPWFLQVFGGFRRFALHLRPLCKFSDDVVRTCSGPILSESSFIYKYIRTMQTQNFRNASKSALRKSKIYIYEQFLDKIFEIPKNLYIRTIIHTNNDHCKGTGRARKEIDKGYWRVIHTKIYVPVVGKSTQFRLRL